jgi:hypothetical protein
VFTIEQQYGEISGKRIADFGCGCGMLTVATALMGSSYNVGFELDLDAIAICKSNLDEYEIQADILHANIEDLDFSPSNEPKTIENAPLRPNKANHSAPDTGVNSEHTILSEAAERAEIEEKKKIVENKTEKKETEGKTSDETNQGEDRVDVKVGAVRDPKTAAEIMETTGDAERSPNDSSSGLTESSTNREKKIRPDWRDLSSMTPKGHYS